MQPNISSNGSFYLTLSSLFKEMIMLKRFFIIYLLLVSALSNAQPTDAGGDTSLIPSSRLGAKTWALASQSVVNIRRAPAYSSEMTTQVLLGTPLKILAKKRNWYQVQTPEGYEGWAANLNALFDSVTLRGINQQPRIIVTSNTAFVYTSPCGGDIVSEVVMGNILHLDGNKKKKGTYKVLFPDGRTGYVDARAVKTWDDWRRSIQLTGSSIENVAKRFVGLPYFWGGTSARGLDCSGLTKTTYLMHGIILPRDARQQYLTGVAIDSTNNFSQLQKGDLMFFGRKYADDTTRYNIVHTAIYLQDRQFIQAGDGNIQISSLDPADENYDNHNRSRYVITKRILHTPQNGTWSIFTHPWYN